MSECLGLYYKYDRMLAKNKDTGRISLVEEKFTEDDKSCPGCPECTALKDRLNWMIENGIRPCLIGTNKMMYSGWVYELVSYFTYDENGAFVDIVGYVVNEPKF